MWEPRVTISMKPFIYYNSLHYHCTSSDKIICLIIMTISQRMSPLHSNHECPSYWQDKAIEFYDAPTFAAWRKIPKMCCNVDLSSIRCKQLTWWSVLWQKIPANAYSTNKMNKDWSLYLQSCSNGCMIRLLREVLEQLMQSIRNTLSNLDSACVHSELPG